MFPRNGIADDTERDPRQHVAAVHSFVAENAVVEERESAAIVDAKQGAFAFAIPGRRGFAEPHVRRQHGEPNVAYRGRVT